MLNIDQSDNSYHCALGFK